MAGLSCTINPRFYFALTLFVLEKAELTLIFMLSKTRKYLQLLLPCFVVWLLANNFTAQRRELKHFHYYLCRQPKAAEWRYFMYREQLILGVVPTKRGFLPMDEAKRPKDKFMAKIRGMFAEEIVKIVDIDELCENGILFEKAKNDAVIAKMQENHIDALFVPFCDFGEEECAAGVAGALKVPTLVWGARDERPNGPDTRGRDTQCGIFAATKVMRRFGVKYSYIWNCETESEDFARGYDRFVRVAMVIKALKHLRIAKIGERPAPFMSVQTNEAALINGIGAITVPIYPVFIAEAAKKILAEKGPEFQAYAADMKSRFDYSKEGEENVEKIAALVMATKDAMDEAGCTVGAMECWSSIRMSLGVGVCTAFGELADMGYPMACETDVNGAITLAIMRAMNLYQDSSFLADLTIRNPEDDNAELLWNCGPFPYSLRIRIARLASSPIRSSLN